MCEGHAESVGALAFARGDAGGDGDSGEKGPRFMFTGSQDRTIKMWDLSSVPASHSRGGAAAEAVKCKSLCTHKAHEKDINALDVSPNGALLASGSQDRTAKVFGITFSAAAAGARGEIALLGTCRGHKRGVWSVRFARHERVLASGGGDRTVRLWSLEDFACLKVLEGHANSVLRVEWLSGADAAQGQGQGRQRPAQVVSAAADGLVKVWDSRTEECVATLDGHEDKVCDSHRGFRCLYLTRFLGWGVGVGARGEQGRAYDRLGRSGLGRQLLGRLHRGAGGRAGERARRVGPQVRVAPFSLSSSFIRLLTACILTFFDVLHGCRRTSREQDFQNYVALHDYRRAIELALALAQPGRLLALFRDVAASASASEPGAGGEDSLTGHPAVDEVVRALHPADLARLLRFVRDWNARAASAAVAQRVLHAVVKLRAVEDVVRAFEGAGAPVVSLSGEDGGEGDRKRGGKEEQGGVRELLEALIPYTERHLARMERLVQESYVVDYVLGEMDDGLDGGEEGMDVDVGVGVAVGVVG